MYEFEQTQKGWIVYWGPRPVQTGPETEPEPATLTFPVTLVREFRQVEAASELVSMSA